MFNDQYDPPTISSKLLINCQWRTFFLHLFLVSGVSRMALRTASSTMVPTPTVPTSTPSPRAVPAPPQAVALLRLLLCPLLRPLLQPVTTPQLRATIWIRATHKAMEAMVEAPRALLLLPLQFLLSPHPLVLTGPMVTRRKCPPNASSTTNFASRFSPGTRRTMGVVRWTPPTVRLLRRQGGFSSSSVYNFRNC